MRWQKLGSKKIRIGIGLLSLVTFLLAGLLIYNHALAQDPVLYWGSRGTQVSQVQQRLKDWGYFQGPVTGNYGAQTAEAVKSFQRRNGLPVDGVVGTATRQAMGLATAAPAAQKREDNYATASRGFVSNRDSINLLARVIMGEAADEPYSGKVAVGAVMLNRVRSDQFPNTLSGVVYQPLAFESVSNGQYNRNLDQEALRAAQDAISGYDPTGGALFFWNPSKPVNRWIWSRKIVNQIGRHVFAY
ncbi:spore cortex-lytic enzyme [Desulforamulus aquiferis]|uniref:Spore cortex-lytic enzyme n=1 Tax=Desulforamulus aquiferis TaxID=1397668 RepID=A0AAW7ZGU3_9FIRM|nr:spore cortex-lytic enzyme [Desulforamulus aquiferis]MDO7788989.1 spore cortex-lytic enzyme [Desulforamulus aquiferis]RYD01381.1 hypothetical protein N752_30775 [Desulforamulus aquiferis]